MKNLVLATLMIVSLGMTAWCQTYTTTQQIGNYRYTTGTVNGQYVNLTQNRIGNYTYTNGTINGQNVNVTSNQLGNYRYTNGQVGNGYYNSNTTQIGNYQYTNGSWTQNRHQPRYGW